MSGFSAFAYPGSSIAEEAAAQAASYLKKKKDSSGRVVGTSRNDEYRLRRRSRKLTQEFQESMEKNVKKKLDSMRGSQRNSKVGLKVAQFIPGKGLEIPGTQAEKDPAVYCSLGLKGVKVENCFDKLFEAVKGRTVSQDFAFKLICEPDLASRTKNSRVATFNCFRHLNPDSFNYQKTGWFQDPSGTGISANRNWHSTLGPDATHIRRSVNGLSSGDSNAGTWRGDANDPAYDTPGGMANIWVSDGDGGGSYSPDMGEAANANSLISPFRTPFHKEYMYSRLNRQVLENYGFALNPFRLNSESNVATWSVNMHEPSSSPLFTPTLYGLAAYRTPSTWLMNFGEQKTLSSSDEKWLSNSLVAKINNSIKFNSDLVEGSANWEYHSQFGSGKLSYQFANDGTNPVCIDICIIGVKKTEATALSNFTNIAQFNYAVNKFASYKTLNTGGYDAVDVTEPKTVDIDLADDEWISDAKLPFIPSQCFKNPLSFTDASGVTIAGNLGTQGGQDLYDALEQGKKNPFKVVKRDQFIVSSGATRSWNTTLPSIKYRPQLYEDTEYPLDLGNANVDQPIATSGDEYTFMLAIGAHGMAVPVEEIYPNTTVNEQGTTVDDFTVRRKAILDRQPSSCNVSVTGTYSEIVHPAYAERVGETTFINGRMIEPYFSVDLHDKPKIPNNSNVELDDRLATVNINTQAQTVRVTNTGVTGVGAINTQVGA